MADERQRLDSFWRNDSRLVIMVQQSQAFIQIAPLFSPVRCIDLSLFIGRREKAERNISLLISTRNVAAMSREVNKNNEPLVFLLVFWALFLWQSRSIPSRTSQLVKGPEICISLSLDVQPIK